MKYFFDTEFNERPCTIDLISIGIKCEDGRTLYLESSEVDWSKANDWVLANVKPKLKGNAVSRTVIRNEILKFVVGDDIDFWGYFADYDWVVFCWLFGTMSDLPKNFPMHAKDLKQWASQLNVNLPSCVPHDNEHSALDDAEWNHRAWNYLHAHAHVSFVLF